MFPGEGEIKVRHFQLTTLFNDTKLPVDLYESRRMGKGPIRRDIWVGQGSELPGSRVHVAVNDVVAYKGAAHVGLSLRLYRFLLIRSYRLLAALSVHLSLSTLTTTKVITNITMKRTSGNSLAVCQLSKKAAALASVLMSGTSCSRSESRNGRAWTLSSHILIFSFVK